MKRMIGIFLTLMIAVFMTACSENPSDPISSTDLPSDTSSSEANSEQENSKFQLNIQIGEHLLTADLADNSSTEALLELLADGPITISMNDYANMEKVGALPQSLPRNDEQINTDAGDLILYQGNSFVIYYDTNSWNFTRLGKINNVTKQELRDILGSGGVTAVLSVPSSDTLESPLVSSDASSESTTTTVSSSSTVTESSTPTSSSTTVSTTTTASTTTTPVSSSTINSTTPEFSSAPEVSSSTEYTSEPTTSESETSEPPKEETKMQLNIQIGDHLLTADLVDNSSVQALLELLANGPITIDMRDYASMEKVGPFPQSLPRNDEQISTDAGDLILYQGNSFVIYYDTNSWNFTRLGKINNATKQELRDILGSGSITAVLSVPDQQ